MAQLRRRWLRPVLAAATVVSAVLVLRGRLPHPADVGAVLAGADWRWLALAVLVQFLSQAAFARQQRSLLSAFSVDISRRDALAITYSRSAISMVLPAGSAMSAAFALRQYQRRGASTAVAATTMVLSGVASAIGLVLLYAGTVGLPSWSHEVAGRVLASTVLLGALIGGLLLLQQRRESTPAPVPSPSQRWTGRLLAQLRGVITAARGVRLSDWLITIACAVLNWLLDLTCLVAVAYACGLPLGVFPLATVYLAVQLVRQIPLTPGGIGLIEASLLAGLVAAGAPQAAAAAVVLGYRLVSFWLVLPAGLFAYRRVSRTNRSAVPDLIHQPSPRLQGSS